MATILVIALGVALAPFVASVLCWVAYMFFISLFGIVLLIDKATQRRPN
jgi:hypothetical protein